MTRFTTPAEVAAHADRRAHSDWHRHAVVHVEKDGTTWQVCRNPYCTVGRRNDWQRGYDNAPPHSFEGTREYDTAFQVGAAYRRLEEKYARTNLASRRHHEPYHNTA